MRRAIDGGMHEEMTAMREMMQGDASPNQGPRCPQGDTECRLEQLQTRQQRMGQRMGMMQMMMEQMMQQMQMHMQQQLPPADDGDPAAGQDQEEGRSPAR